MDRKKLLKRNIKINYGYMFFSSMILDRGIWMLYLAYSGLSLFEIGLVESFYHISSFSLEVPTGAIADVFSRKLSRVLGRLAYVVSIILMLISNSFLGFMVAFFFSALSGCLESGAGDALVYDSLKELKKEQDFVKIKGRQEMIFHLTGVITLMLGGYLAKIDFRLVYLVGAIFAMVTFFVSLGFKEPEIQGKRESNRFIGQLVDSIGVMKKMPKLAVTMLALEGVAACVTTSFFYMQNYMASWGLTPYAIGVVLAIGSIINGLVSWQTGNIEKIFGSKVLLVAIPLMSVIFFFALPFHWLGVVSLVVLSSFESITYVVMSNFVNKSIPSAQRATILSFQSMAFSLMMIIIFPVIGKIGDVIGLSHTLWMIGIFCLVLACLIAINNGTFNMNKGEK